MISFCPTCHRFRFFNPFRVHSGTWIMCDCGLPIEPFRKGEFIALIGFLLIFFAVSAMWMLVIKTYLIRGMQ